MNKHFLVIPSQYGSKNSIFEMREVEKLCFSLGVMIAVDVQVKWSSVRSKHIAINVIVFLLDFQDEVSIYNVGDKSIIYFLLKNYM